MGIFDRQIAQATRMIGAKGQEVTWRQIVDGTPADTDKPWMPGEADTADYTVKMVFLPETRFNLEFLNLTEGTTVAKGRVVGLMAAQAFTPTLKDIVIRDGVNMGVRSVDPLAPNGDIIMYTVRFNL